MPKREEENQVANGAQEQVPFEQNTTNADDAWGKVMEMKSASMNSLVEDENGFNKLNTNYYLLDGEEGLIQFISDIPIIFPGHNIKMFTKAGKPYYITETCQKSNQASCVLCNSKANTIGDARQIIAFSVLDYRGTYRKKDEKNPASKEGWDGVPVPKIFLMPLGLAKSIKKLKDEVGGTLKDKIIKLSKDAKNYTPQVMMDKVDGGLMKYRTATPFTGKSPNINVLYAAQNDEALNRLVNYNTGDNNANTGTTQSGEDAGLFTAK
jgi:hypothetical protein